MPAGTSETEHLSCCSPLFYSREIPLPRDEDEGRGRLLSQATCRDRRRAAQCPNSHFAPAPAPAPAALQGSDSHQEAFSMRWAHWPDFVCCWPLQHTYCVHMDLGQQGPSAGHHDWFSMGSANGALAPEGADPTVLGRSLHQRD